MSTVDSDDITFVPDKGVFKQRRIWYLLAVGLTILSFFVQQPLLFLAGLLAFLIGLLPELWYRTALRHLVVSCTAQQRRLFFGEVITLEISIENQKWLPLPWLHIKNAISPSLTIESRQTEQSAQAKRLIRIRQLVSTWQLWSFQRVTRRYSMRSAARGCYTIGPITVRSSDPFGWLESSLTLPVYETVIVYPLIAQVESAGFPPVSPFGEDAARRHLIEDPLRVVGVRDYQLGDDPRRIHWKATAHTGMLRSKIYEYSTMKRLLVLLDTRNYSHSWMGVDPELQELTISAAASIGVWALDEGYMVGLLANCGIMIEPGADDEVVYTGTLEENDTTEAELYRLSSPTVHVPFAIDEGQYERLLSMLARLVPRHTMLMEETIEMEQHLFQPGTVVVLVSAAKAVSEETAGRLLDMRKRGVAVQLALTGEVSDITTIEAYDLPIQYLGGSEQWHELIEAANDDKSSTIGINAIHAFAFQLD
jgi:uncharacterized protein (DUF58 family)